MIKKLTAIWIIPLFLWIQCGTDNPKEVYEAEVFEQAAVVTAHPIASKIGAEILEKAGNAVDAAVAVKFALAVVYPNAGNLGGGGFLVYRTHQGEKNTRGFREKTPQREDREMYLDSRKKP